MGEMRKMGELTQHLVRAGFVLKLLSIAKREPLTPPLQTGFCTKVTINTQQKVPKPAPTNPVFWEHPVLDKALPQVTQLQGFQPHSKSQRAKLGCSRFS